MENQIIIFTSNFFFSIIPEQQVIQPVAIHWDQFFNYFFEIYSKIVSLCLQNSYLLQFHFQNTPSPISQASECIDASIIEKEFLVSHFA